MPKEQEVVPPPLPVSQPASNAPDVIYFNGETVSPSAMRRPSISSLANKRSRPSPHMKRVSFGGDTVNIINQHRNEFQSPENSSNESSISPSPPGKAMKTTWGSSPAPPPRSPFFLRTNLDLLNDDEEQDDTITIPDSAKLANLADTPTRSPRQGRNGTPVPVRRRSNLPDRKSFGIFLDDEVERVPANLDTARDIDKTFHGPDFDGEIAHAASPSSDDSDGDITQNLPGVMDLADQEEAKEALEPMPHQIAANSHALPAVPPKIGFSPRPSRKSLSYIGPHIASDAEAATRARASKSNRKSLSYMSRNVEADIADKPDGTASKSNRRSLAYMCRPIDANMNIGSESGISLSNKNPCGAGALTRNDDKLADENSACDDEDGNDATLHVFDLLEQVQGDEEDEHAPRHGKENDNVPSPTARPGTDVVSGTTVVQGRPILPDNRQLFDSAEDPTIHYYPSDHPVGQGTEVGKLSIPGTSLGQDIETEDAEEAAKKSDTVMQEVSTEKATPALRRSILKKSSQIQDASRPTENEPEQAPEAENSITSSASKLPTPVSATGAKVRALRGRVSDNGQEGQKSSDIALKSSTSTLGTTSSLKSQKQSLFNIASFLVAGKLHFDDRFGLDLRRPSIAPIPESIGTVDRYSLDWKVLEYVKQEKILCRLQDQVTKHTNAINAITSRMSSIEEKIVKERPHVFEKLASSTSLRKKELQTIQMGLKRLQKVTTRQAGIAWVTSRQLWETEMLDDLKESSATLLRDATGMKSSEKSLSSSLSEFRKGVQLLGHSQDLEPNETDGAQSEKLRKSVAREFSAITDLRKLMASKLDTFNACASEIEALAPKKAELASLHKNLRTYAEAVTNRKLNAILAERRELNTIVCGVSALKPISISGNNISVVLADIMDVRLDVKDDKVTKAVGKPVSLPTTASSIAQLFASGAVELARPYLEQLQSTSQIPSALYQCSAALNSTWRCFTEALQYFDGHLGEINNASLSTGKLPSLDLNLLASFYSLKLRVKFDVTVVISCFCSDPAKGLPYQEVQRVDCSRFIGTTPSDETVREVVISSGFRKDKESFSALDAFAGVWDIL